MAEDLQLLGAEKTCKRECKEVFLLLSSNPRLTLKEIAILTNIDRHKIQHAIREQYGFGFKELRKAIRFDLAILLLSEKPRKYRIKEVAVKLGLTPNYLSRLIKSMSGCCATDLRRL
jgi:AraC-like DNA-binding protein